MIALRDAGYPIADMFKFLWEQHNEHRIVLPKLVYFIDMVWFGYEGYFPLVCIFIFQAMMATALIWLFFSGAKGEWVAWLYIPLTIVGAFNLIQFENFVSTFQTSFIGCFAFAVVALALYARFVEKGRKAYFVWVVIFAVMSSLSLASGMFIWLILAIYAFILHDNRHAHSLIFTSTFIVFLLLYLLGYKSSDGHANPTESLTHHLLEVLEFFSVWLGNVAGTVTTAKLFGAIGLAVYTGIVIHLAYDKDRQLHAELYALLGIGLFVMLSGFVTSLGRVNFGISQAMASRYTSPVLIFWVSLLGVVLLIAIRANRLGFIRISIGVVLVAFVGLLAHNSRSENSLIAFQNRQIQAYLGLVTGVFNDQPKILMAVYPEPDSIISKVEMLKKHHLSSYSSGASAARFYEMGMVITASGRKLSSSCKGNIDEVSAISQETYKLFGWAWDEASSSYPEWIYLVKEGKIIGMAQPGIQRPDVIAANPEIKLIRVGWQGVARVEGEIGLNDIEAYILTKNGEYCRF